MIFEVLMDEAFINLDTHSLSVVDNKHVLSLINDFEGGNWRYDKFQNYIWDNIAQTALSKKERDSLIDQHRTVLVESAKRLRLANNDKKGKGSELCEILLYGVMKDHYSALSVVPKIFYKQNSQDNAKGADSVHIVIEGNGCDFSLWFGEAKFYKDIDQAITSAITSVDNFLRDDDKIKKENSIITSISDLYHMNLTGELLKNIETSLSFKSSLDDIKPKINIPILLLYECSITEQENELTEKYKKSIIDFHTEKANKYFKSQVGKISDIFKYKDIKFHLILFPIPNKKCIVDKFIDSANHYRV